MTDNFEYFVYNGSNFKMWKKLLINILKAENYYEFIKSYISDI